MSTGNSPRQADPADVDRARGLLDDFFAERSERTFQAYSTDVEDFRRFLEVDRAEEAVARLLANGPDAGTRHLLDFAVSLRRRGRASATIARRLATLRALARLAAASGLVEWSLQVPTETQLEAALQAGDDDVPYLFPRHPSEMDRLDVQHYALREALGASYLAPVEVPERILDVGSGTGQWAYEACWEYPDATVVGLDLVPSKTPRPPGYRWVRANVLDGLPFRTEAFDFVHQRVLVVGVPLTAWPGVIAELVRVTRPGGWVEVGEPRIGADNIGPATARFNDLALELAGSVGLDTTGVVYRDLDQYLRDAGLEDVTRREVPLPIGQWGGRVGSLMATDFRAAYARLAELLRQRSALSEADARALLERAWEECEERHTTGAFAIAYGRRRSTSAPPSA